MGENTLLESTSPTQKGVQKMLENPMTIQTLKKASQKIKMLLFDCDGVMTDGRIVLGTDGTELKFFSAIDGLGIKIWHQAGFSVGTITGRSSEGLEKRASELNFEELHQSIARKGDVLDEILARRGLAPEEVAYIGDDINDLPVGTRVGLFFVPANHHQFITPYADYILRAKGGHGVVREAIDLLLTHKGLIDGIVKNIINS